MAFDHADTSDLDVIIIGAGVAGLYAIYRLRKLGLKVRAAAWRTASRQGRTGMDDEALEPKQAGL